VWWGADFGGMRGRGISPPCHTSAVPLSLPYRGSGYKGTPTPLPSFHLQPPCRSLSTDRGMAGGATQPLTTHAAADSVERGMWQRVSGSQSPAAILEVDRWLQVWVTWGRTGGLKGDDFMAGPLTTPCQPPLPCHNQDATSALFVVPSAASTAATPCISSSRPEYNSARK